MRHFVLCLLFCVVGSHTSTREENKQDPLKPNLDQSITDVYEYGWPNEGHLVFVSSGSIPNGSTGRVTQIPIVIPECHYARHVSFELENPAAPGYVTLNETSMVITVRFRPHQYSASVYWLAAKALIDEVCYEKKFSIKHQDEISDQAYTSNRLFLK